MVVGKYLSQDNFAHSYFVSHDMVRILDLNVFEWMQRMILTMLR